MLDPGAERPLAPDHDFGCRRDGEGKSPRKCFLHSVFNGLPPGLRDTLRCCFCQFIAESFVRARRYVGDRAVVLSEERLDIENLAPSGFLETAR